MSAVVLGRFRVIGSSRGISLIGILVFQCFWLGRDTLRDTQTSLFGDVIELRHCCCKLLYVNSKAIGFVVVVGNTTRNENIIAAVKVIVIGQYFSFAKLHRWTATHGSH